MIKSDVIKLICKKFNDSKYISTIGTTSRELYTQNDNLNNFYMLGSMGLASSFGFGLALSSPKNHIIIFDGDGSILMNLGSLTTIGSYNLKNLLLIIIDNEVYETTGNQKTNTFYGTNLYKIAKGANCFPVYVINTIKKLKYIINNNNYGVLIVKVNTDNKNKKTIMLSPEKIKTRFIKACQNTL